jgi:hypothetical protein
MNLYLRASLSPVQVGMMVSDVYGRYTTPLSSELSWIDAQIASGGSYPKLAGFSLWSCLPETTTIRSVDWTAWNNWATRFSVLSKYLDKLDTAWVKIQFTCLLLLW